MAINWLKKIVCCLGTACCCAQACVAQNLFANPGFEATNNCVEFKADCAPEAWFNIPAGNFLVNGRIAPKPYAGDMVLVIPAGNVMHNFNKPRYVYTGLCCPLLKNKKYLLSFYLNTAGAAFNQLALFFTEKEPALNTVNLLADTAALIIKNENSEEQFANNWKHVQLLYTANGNEQFFIFTTKGLPSVKYSMDAAMNKSGDVLYFIDEISLQPQDAVTPCTTYKATADKLFEHNYRHTNYVPVFKQDAPAAPVVKFISDTIIIPGLLFDVNKSDIKPGVQKITDSICLVLQQRKILQVTITGHTDSTGMEKDNLLLSYARAVAIKNYLIAKLPQLSQKIEAVGKAAVQPVATNTTAAGRQRNRRVAIVITYAAITK